MIQLPQLTEVPGPTITVSQSLLEMFSQFFSDDIIQLIVRETNRRQQQTAPTTQFETNEEKRAYFGFMVLIGINKLPEMRDYWAFSDQLHYSLISDRISRSRFESITRNLHFTNHTNLLQRGDPEYDKLQKIRPAINHLTQSFLFFLHSSSGQQH